MAEELKEEIIEAIPVDAIIPNAKIGYTIYVKLDDKFNIYLQRGKRFGTAEMTKLKSKRVEYVYIKDHSKPIFLQDVLTHLGEVSSRVKSKDALIGIYYDLLEMQVKEIFSDGLNEKNIELSKKFIAHIVDLALSASSCVTMLINILDEHSTRYQHSLNVMVYSLILGKMLTLKQAELEILSFGALLHDIAKRESEYYEDTHMIRGVEILKESGIEDKQILRMVLEHHEYLDGSGFPSSLEAGKISKYAQIVTITNVFDNLCSKENGGMSTFDALKEMKSKMSSKLNETALHAFIVMFKKQRA